MIRLDRAQAHDENGRALSAAELLSVCEMVDAAFATRRKTLANSCKTFFASSPDALALLSSVFEAAGVDPRRRGETLTQAEFVKLGLTMREMREEYGSA